MKIKKDFVTNSSSCSFIMIGFQVPLNKNYEEIEDKVNEVGKRLEKHFAIYCGTEGGAPSDDVALIGKEIASIHDDDGYREFKFNKDISDIIELAKEFNMKEDDIKYLTGVMMC